MRVSRRHGILKTLSVLLPAGALGASAALALTSSANAMPAQTQSPETATQPSVSSRLELIRAGVSVIESTTDPGSAGAGVTLPSADPDDVGAARVAWWGNGGFGRFRFGWGNGGWGWHNGGWGNGWHNGGWGNGGWGNGWHNGGWGNGGGWRNFWHNG
jgi:rSAM-associated Gly-rich repeat protein